MTPRKPRARASSPAESIQKQRNPLCYSTISGNWAAPCTVFSVLQCHLRKQVLTDSRRSRAAVSFRATRLGHIQYCPCYSAIGEHRFPPVHADPVLQCHLAKLGCVTRSTFRAIMPPANTGSHKFTQIACYSTISGDLATPCAVLPMLQCHLRAQVHPGHADPVPQCHLGGLGYAMCNISHATVHQ